MFRQNSAPLYGNNTLVPPAGTVPPAYIPMGIAPGLAGTNKTVVQYVPTPAAPHKKATKQNNENYGNVYPVNLNLVNKTTKHNEYSKAELAEMGKFMTPNRPTKNPFGGIGKLPWGAVAPGAPLRKTLSAISPRKPAHPGAVSKRLRRRARKARKTRRTSRTNRR